MFMPTVFFDIETRSTADLEVAGAWRYAADPATEVLCLAYAVNDDDPQIWIPGDPIPETFKTATTVVAHNFMFERAVLTRILIPRFGWPEIPLERQVCSMTMALACALPGSLDKVAAALGLPFQKDREGYTLMRKMSRPLPRRKSDPPDLIRWHDIPEARAQLAEYCRRDVELERAVFHALPPLLPSEQTLFVLDAVINRRGFHVDVELANAARDIAQKERIAINAEITTLTEGEITTANQRDRIVAFVRRHGHTLSSLTKRAVSAVLAHEPGDPVRRLLELRREGARASASKLNRLLKGVDSDHRLRGSLRFHAAGPGRWSGRGYQPQNLKKIETSDIDAAVDAILVGDMDRVRELGAPLTIAGDVSRSVICAAPEHKLIGGDFSAIESRVLAWLAGETWKLENYRRYDITGDPTLEPYCATATRMLGRMVTPEDEAGRQIGKTADLALGYAGSIGAWRRFNPDDDRPDGEILQNIADWRRAHSAIVKFWKDLHRAAIQAVHTGQRIELGKIAFVMGNGTLRMVLASGRAISYPQARLGAGKFEGTRAIYFKDNAKGGWAEVSSWHGLLTENLVQGVARDLLAAAIVRLEVAGYPVVLHVHDEVVCEVPEGACSTENFLRLLTELPDWAAELPIAAKAWSGKRYTKTAKGTPDATIALPTAPAPSTTELEEDQDREVDVDDDDTAVPLADVIGEPLVDGKILCPFHDDHTPSLTIYPDHFHCFVCNAHGDAIDWLMLSEGMTRREAVHHLAAWDGPRVAQAQDNKEKTRAYALQLWNEGGLIAGTLAARYLTEIRGIDLTVLPDNVAAVIHIARSGPIFAILVCSRSCETPSPTNRLAFTGLGSRRRHTRSADACWATPAQ
jgi:DNA polymerase